MSISGMKTGLSISGFAIVEVAVAFSGLLGYSVQQCHGECIGCVTSNLLSPLVGGVEGRKHPEGVPHI